MRRIDELHMEFPFAGARTGAPPRAHAPAEEARGRGGAVLQAEHEPPQRAAHLAVPAAWLRIARASQVFALDTTYIAMARGFAYLTAVVDWASRKILAHRVAI